MDNDKLTNEPAATGGLSDQDLASVVGGTDLQSLTLQNYLNHQAQAITTISNVMKKESSTAETIIENMK